MYFFFCHNKIIYKILFYFYRIFNIFEVFKNYKLAFNIDEIEI